MTVESTTDWLIVEQEYRAGIRPLRDIAADAGITEGAIRKRAKRDQWSRNLHGKIQAKAAEKVRKDAVRVPGTQLTPATEQQVVEANAEVIAGADLLNRKDVVLGIDLGRGQLQEIAALSNPEFAETLAWVGEMMRAQDAQGLDKVNDLYRYVISLAGRVKNLKDIVASIATLIQLQRKILKLDDDADKSQTAVDDLLRKINLVG